VRRDPHEAAPRRGEFAKDERAEDLLFRVNELLAGASLPEPPPDPDAVSRPILYTVGVPRSGTTVLAQLVARHLPVGYIDGLAARFWRRPSVGVALSLAVLGPIGGRQIALASRHGVSAEVTGPHEFGYFWRHWLRLDDSPSHHPSPEHQATIDIPGLRRALEHELLASFRAPVAFRNSVCGFHAGLLSRIHPATLFVHIRRDPLECARSILACRKERYGSYQAWWSLKPSTWPFGGESDPAAQVARQVTDCRRELELELSMPKVHAIAIEYADLCRDPRDSIERIRSGLAAFGAKLPLQGDLPTALPMGGARHLPEALERRLAERLPTSPLETPPPLR
jgi:hypothetical protein